MSARILIIEDCQGIRETIAEILQLESFQVLEAEDGRIGLRLARTELPDLIICDLMMPNLNGAEVMAQLRQHPSTQNIPFLLVTAQSELTDLGFVMALSHDDYVTKPFTRDRLLRAVSDKLTRSSIKPKCC